MIRNPRIRNGLFVALATLVLAAPGWGQTDTTRPTVTITVSEGASDPPFETFTATFTFSEPLAHNTFGWGDITVTNGRKGSLNFSTPPPPPQVFTMTIDPSDYQGRDVTIDVPENVTTDVAGNGNEAASLTVTSPGLFPNAPTGLTAEPRVNRVVLNWDDPNDSSITGYQYRVRLAAQGHGEWNDMPGADATTTSFTVTETDLPTDLSYAGYYLQIRARNAAGSSAEAFVRVRRVSPDLRFHGEGRSYPPIPPESPANTPFTQTVIEGVTESYGVKLYVRPDGPVTVTVTSSDTSKATVVTPTLTFTPSNWDTRQYVRVMGQADADGIDDTFSLIHMASGGGFGGVTATLSAKVVDDEGAGTVRTVALPENTAPGHMVASLTVQDQDPSPYVATLGGRDPEAFTVRVTGLTVELFLNTALDYETKSSFRVTIVLVEQSEPLLGFMGAVELTVTDIVDEVEYTIAAETPWVTEGADARFPVSASAAPAADTQVRLALEVYDDGGGPQRRDATVTIPAGATGGVLVVPTVNDDLDEPDGRIVITLLPGEGYTVGERAGAEMAVRDDEPAPQLMVVSQTLRENGGAADLPVTATGRTTARFVCWADLNDPRTTAGAGDFGGLAASHGNYQWPTVGIPRGETLSFRDTTNRHLNVWSVQDGVKEGDETLVVRCKLASGWGGTASGTLTITERAGPLLAIADPPADLAATTDREAEIALSWTEPAKDGGTPPVGYAISVSTDGGASWIDLATVHGPETGYTHRAGPGQSRHYRVATINAFGIGVWSAPVRGATAQAPVAAAAPTVSDASAFAEHAAVVGQPFHLVLPAADAGSGDGVPYEYILWKRGAGVHFGENGLVFDPATRRVSGTPEAPGVHDLAYQIHDGDDDRSRGDSFLEETALRITVTAAPGAKATEPMPCVAELGALSAEAVSLEDEAWDVPDCRAHHRDDRPARYFSFTLDEPATVSLALTSDSAASLFVSAGTPKNGWGAAPKGAMEHRLETRRANGKLVHEEGLAASLALEAGSYTAEAVLDEDGADPAASMFALRVEAADPGAGTADTAPTVSDTSVFADHEAVVGEAFSLTLPAADEGSGNGGPYAYALHVRGGGADFADGIDGLVFDPETRILSGTPERAGVHELTYTVHDGDANTGDADAFRESESLRVTVRAASPVAGGAPTVSDTSAFANHVATVGEAFSLTLPAADAGSGDGGPYEYILWKRNAGVHFGENGLSFDPATRTVSGTPEAAGAFDLAYQVHDGDADRGLADSFVEETALRITVAPGGAPVGGAPVTLTVASPTVGEDAGRVGVLVLASRTTDGSYRCWAAGQDPRTTATRDVDYTAARQRDAVTLDLSARRFGTFHVTVLADSVAEPEEAVTVRCRPESDLSDALAGADGLLTIVDDDDPAVSVVDARANESDGTIAFAVTLDLPARERATVSWATADGTALAGEDYAAGSGTLTFLPGESAKTVEIGLLDDAHDEGEETFRLVLSDPVNLQIGDGEAIGTIVNSDPALNAWLARFGRTVAGQTVAALTERFAVAPGAGSHVTLGGQRLALGDGGAPPDGEAGAVPAPNGDAFAALASRDGRSDGGPGPVSGASCNGSSPFDKEPSRTPSKFPRTVFLSHPEYPISTRLSRGETSLPEGECPDGGGPDDTARRCRDRIAPDPARGPRNHDPHGRMAGARGLAPALGRRAGCGYRLRLRRPRREPHPVPALAEFPAPVRAGLRRAQLGPDGPLHGQRRGDPPRMGTVRALCPKAARAQRGDIARSRHPHPGPCRRLLDPGRPDRRRRRHGHQDRAAMPHSGVQPRGPPPARHLPRPARHPRPRPVRRLSAPVHVPAHRPNPRLFPTPGLRFTTDPGEPRIMSMFPPEILTLIGTVVGTGIALATLILVTTARGNQRIDNHIAATDDKFEKYLTRNDGKFDTYLAEAANDRRAMQAGIDEFRKEMQADMNEFRRQMQRLAERQSRVEGHQSSTAAPAE